MLLLILVVLCWSVEKNQIHVHIWYIIASLCIGGYPPGKKHAQRGINFTVPNYGNGKAIKLPKGQ